MWSIWAYIDPCDNMKALDGVLLFLSQGLFFNVKFEVVTFFQESLVQWTPDIVHYLVNVHIPQASVYYGASPE